MNNELLDMIVKIIAAIIGVVITSYIIPWIKSKMNNAKYDQIVVAAKLFVEAAEKIYTPEEWQAKKVYVFDMIVKKAESMGLDITDQELDAIIEGFVLEVKK